MATVKEKKDACIYTEHPMRAECASCAHYTSKFVPDEFLYMQEKSIRCGKHGFKVKKTASCADWNYANA